MTNGLFIKEVEDFETLPPEKQRVLLFRNVLEIREQKGCQIEKCEDRFKNIEKRKWWNTAASAGGGIIGGFTAMIVKFKFWG
jgi:hypothetical protein